MRTARELILDAWSWLGFKSTLGDGISVPDGSWRPATWVGEEHERRLAAYHLQEAYDRNSARRYRAALAGEQSDVREYGDAFLINRTVLSAVLGDSQAVTVPGADGTPTEPGDPGLAAAQEWYRQWWEDERGGIKMHRAERRAVKLGNGIYALGWDPDVGRVRLRDYEPGFFFPVPQPGDEEFPSKVHLAWEETSPQLQREGKVRIVRKTWHLRMADDGGMRSYPWNDRPSRLACYYTDATFEMKQTRGNGVDELDPSAAVYAVDEQGEIRDRDIGVDFIPLINIPNTIDDGDGWGIPSTFAVAQILDELAQTDTNIAAAAVTAASPVVFVSGASFGGQSPTYRPGEIWSMGQDGRADVLDTAQALVALHSEATRLEDRMAAVARTPAAIMGKVKPSEVPSGFAFALGFGPLAAMIRQEMRQARKEKYRLLYKFLRRMSLANGVPDVPASDVPAEMTFGAFLPQDKAAAVDLVRKILGGASDPPAGSLEFCVSILVEAGFPVGATEELVRQIRRADYAAATRLLDATGDEQAVRDLLHTGDLPDLSGPPPAAPPAPEPEIGIPLEQDL